MPSFRTPDVLADGHWWSGDELNATAVAWHACIREALGDDLRAVAAAVPTTPEGVALFSAVTSIPVPVILLVPDPRAWRGSPSVPVGTTVVLPPSLAHLAPAVRRLGCVPCPLPDRCAGAREPGLTPLQASGIILFTSGSTGPPRPVFRSMTTIVANAATRLEALGLGRGDGIIAGVSLAHGTGLTRVISAMLLGGPLGLLKPVDHRAALAMLGRSEFALWSATAHFADVLGRCRLTAPAVAPRICLLSSPVPRTVYDAFLNRFGVPLRQNYSSTETGSLTVDDAPAPDVRPETVGRPLRGVELRVGNRPDSPLPDGTVGPVWVRSPWQMEGYGYPPDLECPGMVDGWWPTRDLGSFAADGRLRLAGRVDDCIRTREGRLVNLFAVANDLRALGGVRAVEVVPLLGPAGSSFGAVVECEPSTTPTALRRQLSATLPPWAWPRRLALVASLPRLPNGKIDRRACLATLGEAVGS